MARRVSATEAKSRFGAIVDSISKEGDDVIIENRGTPVAAIIAIADYQKLEQNRIEQRRDVALQKLKALQRRVREKNPDLTAEDVERLAKQVVSDAVAAIDEKHLAGQMR